MLRTWVPFRVPRGAADKLLVGSERQGGVTVPPGLEGEQVTARLMVLCSPRRILGSGQFRRMRALIWKLMADVISRTNDLGIRKRTSGGSPRQHRLRCKLTLIETALLSSLSLFVAIVSVVLMIPKVPAAAHPEERRCGVCYRTSLAVKAGHLGVG